MKLIVKLISSVCVVLSSVVANAQNDTEQYSEQWYQVELLVFAYQKAGQNNLEIWPQVPGLSYPGRIIELSSALPTEVMLNNPVEKQRVIDEQFIHENAINTGVIEPASRTLGEAVNENGLTNTIDTETDPEITTPLPQLLLKLDQQPFTLLDRDQLTFRGYLNRLARQSDIRPLFHGAWRQPIAERSEAESILIQGGDQFDNHFELEGSISVGLERYLHIKTDLWLSTFVSNIGRDNNLWPVLPPHPITSSQQAVKQLVDPFSTTPGHSQLDSSNQFENPFMRMAGNQYSVERTVALQQDRRMRSEELHYIDHPLMGLLVKITPYEFPVEEIVELPNREKANDSEAEPEAVVTDGQ